MIGEGPATNQVHELLRSLGTRTRGNRGVCRRPRRVRAHPTRGAGSPHAQGPARVLRLPGGRREAAAGSARTHSPLAAAGNSRNSLRTASIAASAMTPPPLRDHASALEDSAPRLRPRQAQAPPPPPARRDSANPTTGEKPRLLPPAPLAGILELTNDCIY